MSRKISVDCPATLAFVLAFDVGLYDYYRGSVLTAYHSGPVSAGARHFTLSDSTLLREGGLRFQITLDGGTASVPAHVMKAEIVAPDGKIVAAWDAAALSALPAAAIVNDFAYNTFRAGPFGLEARMGAKAAVTLPRPAGGLVVAPGDVLRITDVDGRTFACPIATG